MSGCWVPLRPNDSIYIVAPAARTPDAWVELARGCEWIQAAGFKPIYDETIFADDVPLQAACGFANTDDARYHSFVRAVNSDSRVIWCFRGGYGSDRVATRLMRDRFMPAESTPKLLVGFSDITVLHHYCRIHWQWPTLHAPVLRQLATKKIVQQDVEQLKRWLCGETTGVSLSLEGMNPAAGVERRMRAELTGGNLTVIQSGMGTPWEMPRDGIVLFEDVNEAPYRVARILQQWLSSRWLETVQAVIFADFISAAPEDMQAVLMNFAAQFPQPVLRCEGIGHGERNHPLPFGVQAELSLGHAAHLNVQPIKSN